MRTARSSKAVIRVSEQVRIGSELLAELAVNEVPGPLTGDSVHLLGDDSVTRVRLATDLIMTLRRLFLDFAAAPPEQSMPADHFMDVFRQFAVHWTVDDIPPSGALDPEALKVEDEDGVRDIVCRILTTAGYDVRVAANPREALELCGAEPRPFDMLLSDVIMPGMSGTQLAAQLRLDRPLLPVLFMSGYTSGPAPGGQEIPADAPLIRKPFPADGLLRAVHQLLHRPDRGTEPV